MSAVLTVSQVNMFIKSLIDGDGRLKNILISGEISNFTNHYKSGHLYFSLKDSGGVIKAVMFAESAKQLKFIPKDGMKVIVAGRVSVYEGTGQYQIYIRSMQPDGLGALNLAYEQLKEKLGKEGLFNNNRPLPKYPSRIAVITSPTGAAVQDILNILARRWPAAQVIMCPSAVQGDLAAGQLTAAVVEVNRLSCADVIIIGRGGGSIEDLWAFNSEELARAIFNSKIPVISAVGHETDYTICDFVSDMRAPTPSAAAELAVPNIYDEMDKLEQMFLAMKTSSMAILQDYKMFLDSLTATPYLSDPKSVLIPIKRELSELNTRLSMNQRHNINLQKLALSQYSGKLDELSPLKTLSRGYSILSDNKGHSVLSSKNVKIGDILDARLYSGEIKVEVHAISERNEEDAKEDNF